MNLRNAVVIGSLFTVVSGCSLLPEGYLPEGFPSRVSPDSPEKLFVDDINTDEVPVAAAKVGAAPEKAGLKIRKSKRGNMESYVVRGQRYYTLPSSEEYSARGTASWYGPNFHGRTASNGEVYDMYRLTAAHKTLPLPTYARVTHAENGRSVVVKINDRGPFSGDRIIDLSFAAALRLGMINDGTGEVEIQALSAEEMMVLSGPENKLDIDFYYTDENGIDVESEDNASDVAAADSSDQEELVSVAAVDVDPGPITAKPISDLLADGEPTKDQASVEPEQVIAAKQVDDDQVNNDQSNNAQVDNSPAGDELDSAELPVVADVNVQGIVTVPAAVQSVQRQSAPDAAAPNADIKDRNGYYIQAGVYANVSDAERVAVDVVLASQGEEVNVKPLKDSHLYRVTVGPIVTPDHAAKVSGLLSEAGLENFTVRVK